MTYAKGTEVSVEKSEAEIKGLLRRYGATGFIIGEDIGRAQVAFEMNERRVLFRMPLPQRNEQRFTHYKRGGSQWNLVKRADDAAIAAWQQGCREKWRALVLCIKAKLESVASGIETFDQAFLAHLMLPSGETMGEWSSREENQRALFSTNHPPLLPGPRD